MEDEVALLQGFGDEGLVLFGWVAREGVDIVISEVGMYFFFVVLINKEFYLEVLRRLRESVRRK
jgi:hypothetical protein